MARLKTTRDPLHQDAPPDPKGHGHNAKATPTLFRRRMTPNRADGRCGIPTPKQSPVSRSCSSEEEGTRKRTCCAGKPATSSNKKKRVKKTTGTKGSVEANGTRARELTSLLGRALNAIKHHEEKDYPKESDCTALIPLASKPLGGHYYWPRYTSPPPLSQSDWQVRIDRVGIAGRTWDEWPPRGILGA